MNFILIVLISFSLWATEDIDLRLRKYIKDFQLSSLKAPSEKNEELFNLGQSLFMEKALAGNENIRCIDCHHPRVNTHDDLALALGEGAFGLQLGVGHRTQGSARVLPRNTQALFNLHNVEVMFWDGRVEFHHQGKQVRTPLPIRPEVLKTITSALALQALFPLVDHDEMRGLKGSNPIADAPNEMKAWDLIFEKVMSIFGYREAFERLYPGEQINIGHIAEAIAHFETHEFFSSDTPYDRYLNGDLDALTQKQKIGMDVFFGKGKCGECHRGEHLSNFEFESVLVPQVGPGKQDGDDFGRYQWEKIPQRKYTFRVPPLRNVALTAPYFHDGSYPTLLDVIDHHNDMVKSLESYRVSEFILDQLNNYLKPVQDHNPSSNDERIELLPPYLPRKLYLTELEKSSLLEFLEVGLTDDELAPPLK